MTRPARRDRQPAAFIALKKHFHCWIIALYLSRRQFEIARRLRNAQLNDCLKSEGILQ
jgi:hypothetical protein